MGCKPGRQSARRNEMSKNRRLPILSVVPAGTRQFERWTISDQRDRLWTGEGFGSEGWWLYASYNAAACDTQDILRSHFQGIEPVLFEVPLVVEVLADH